MSDFLVAVGLVLVFEGLLFAAFPEVAKRAMTSALETPDTILRLVGIVSAVLGVLTVALVRSVVGADVASRVSAPIGSLIAL